MSPSSFVTWRSAVELTLVWWLVCAAAALVWQLATLAIETVAR